MNEELKIRLEQHKMWLLDNTKGEGFYTLSEYLNNKYYIFNSGTIYSAFNPCGSLRLVPKKIKQRPLKNGYLSVSLSGKNKLVHRAVADAFIDRVKGKIVHHKDRDKANNCFRNLEVTTSSVNNKHGHVTRKELNKKIITEMIRYYRKDVK